MKVLVGDALRDGCLFLINMSKILSTSNIRLFLNTTGTTSISFLLMSSLFCGFFFNGKC
jgi:hypothetical protein